MSRARPLSARTWAALAVCVALSVVVAVTTVSGSRRGHGHIDAAPARAALARLTVTEKRLDAPGYDRTAFGVAWTDTTDAGLGGNGCDTRNDILDRDLTDKTYTRLRSCPRGVAAGELRSPYTGEWIAFRRGRDTATAVQIDHIVPLSYAWDMGAWRWDPATRARLANDPANLVAVDGTSNQEKSDSPPAEWMPPRSSFACSYAVQFVIVSATYGLGVDARSIEVLRRALRRC